MSATVIAVVLLAALFHASWNALVKAGGDRWLTTMLITGGGALIAGIAVPFLPLPAPHHWPWLVASGLLHLVYFALLVFAYGHRDFGQVYPIARGSAPLLVFVVAGPALGDAVSTGTAIGIVAIAAGVMGLAWRGVPFAADHARATVYALLTGGAIASYTIVDVAGVRIMSADLPAAAITYLAWMMIVTGIPFAAVVGWRRRAEIAGQLRQHALPGIGGAALALASYGIVLWAFAQAPAAPVAALRETGVVFAALIATLVLGERFGRHRIPAAIIGAAGAAGIHFAG